MPAYGFRYQVLGFGPAAGRGAASLIEKETQKMNVEHPTFNIQYCILSIIKSDHRARKTPGLYNEIMFVFRVLGLNYKR
jgi:hypothetical protein